MTQDELQAQFDRYDAILQRFGGPDAESLAEVRRIVFALRHRAGGDPYVLEKLVGMQEWAEIGLSTRKSESYGGVERVRVFAMCEAESAKSVMLRA